jgi:hypothetical protein
MSSVILHTTVLGHFPLIFSAQPFSIEQCHSFTKWLSRRGALTHLYGAIAQLFYDFAKSFFIATLLSHFPLLIAQSFFIVAVLSHFATVLGHF